MTYLNIKLILLFSCILCFSCKEHEDIEYYTDTNIIKEKRKYPDNKNDSTFYVNEFYRNGTLKSEGWVIDFRSEGEWKYYYADGDLQKTIFFNYGIPDYASVLRKKPLVILDNSFEVGKTTFIKVTNLYPDEGFLCVGNNTQMKRSENNNYDYEITPSEVGEISFYTETLKPVPVDKACLNQLYQDNIITQSQKESEHTYIYEMNQVKLGTFVVLN